MYMWTFVRGKARSYPKKVAPNYKTPEKCFEGLLRNGNPSVVRGRTQTYERERVMCPRRGQIYSATYLPTHLAQHD